MKFVQMFSIEGDISLPDRFQSYYLLACSNCNHFVRRKTQRKITCLQCAKRSILIPRGYFEVDITDSSGAPTAVVSEALAETMLSMTAEQVYDTVATKVNISPQADVFCHVRQHESPPVAQINRKFGHRLFKIQLHRPPFRIPDQKINTLAILSFLEKEPTLQESLPVPTFLSEASKKLKDATTSREP